MPFLHIARKREDLGISLVGQRQFDISDWRMCANMLVEKSCSVRILGAGDTALTPSYYNEERKERAGVFMLHLYEDAERGMFINETGRSPAGGIFLDQTQTMPREPESHYYLGFYNYVALAISGLLIHTASPELAQQYAGAYKAAR
jgi:hypothetical protein